MSSRYFEGVTHANVYAKFRPVPPPLLTKRIVSFLQEKYSGPFHIAVDVGCGSGQSTKGLAEHFKSVVGLDISEAQIEEAVKENSFPNITYRVGPAETLSFDDESVQLVTAGQACHWFDLPKFYEEINRILVPNGIVALYGYNFPRLIWEHKGEELYNLMMKVYEATENYAGKQRRYAINDYTDDIFKIPLAESIRDNSFSVETKVTLQDLIGYLSTTSGYQSYRKAKGDTAANELLIDFKESALKTMKMDSPENATLTMRFLFFMILGRKGVLRNS